MCPFLLQSVHFNFFAGHTASFAWLCSQDQHCLCDVDGDGVYIVVVGSFLWILLYADTASMSLSRFESLTLFFPSSSSSTSFSTFSAVQLSCRRANTLVFVSSSAKPRTKSAKHLGVGFHQLNLFTGHFMGKQSYSEIGIYI